LVGLNEEDVRRLIAAAVRDGQISESDIRQILNFKKEDSGGDGMVDFDFDVAGFDGVGGLTHLKHWLSLRRGAFLEPHGEMEFDPPKGVLLLGVQGSGKSLAAKAIAGTWHVPLMKMDFGSLYSKWLGESEHNVKHALQQAEAMAPCVLWIDEIEKGIANDGDAADGGVSKRILGTLLTWMAERKSRVFLVATANDVSKLPPELLRKGRFDEIFFVDLPAAGVRRDIFAIHLKKRKLNPQLFDLQALSDASEGFAGAEIEQAVIAGLYRALGDHQSPNTHHILDELRNTQPLSVLMAEKMTALRSWAHGRTVRAD
jgi:SpoVK/Ycf46/Vps4 family AAA+-type ATPase